MNKKHLFFFSLLITICFINPSLKAQKERSEIAEADTWNVYDLYESDEA